MICNIQIIVNNFPSALIEEVSLIIEKDSLYFESFDLIKTVTSELK